MAADKKELYSVQTVTKALDLIDLLSEVEGYLTLPHLAERLDLNRNKVYRLLVTLEGRGIVERDDISGGYRLGIASVEMAQKIMKNANIVNHAHPIMEELAKRHDEAVYLTVLKGDEVMFLDMVDCEQNIKAAPLIGHRFPFFTNASGMAMKALESRDILERLFKRRKKAEGLPDLAELESQLDAIREKGVAVNEGGLGDGIISVAVAIRDYAGKVVGALTILGPSFRMLADRLESEIIPSILEEGAMLSEKFGYARG